jgi:hypothetical protein
MKLGKRQTAIFVLIGISVSLNFYMNKLIATAQTFSDAILIGFIMGLLLVSSFATLFLWGNILYLNFKVAKHAKSIKTAQH